MKFVITIPDALIEDYADAALRRHVRWPWWSQISMTEAGINEHLTRQMLAVIREREHRKVWKPEDERGVI